MWPIKTPDGWGRIGTPLLPVSVERLEPQLRGWFFKSTQSKERAAFEQEQVARILRGARS